MHAAAAAEERRSLKITKLPSQRSTAARAIADQREPHNATAAGFILHGDSRLCAHRLLDDTMRCSFKFRKPSSKIPSFRATTQRLITLQTVQKKSVKNCAAYEGKLPLRIRSNSRVPAALSAAYETPPMHGLK